MIQRFILARVLNSRPELASWTRVPGSHARRGNPRPDALRRETGTVHECASPARGACKTWVPTPSVGTRCRAVR